MSYDFSFLSKEWNDFKEEIRDSQVLLKYDTTVALSSTASCCDKVITKVFKIEKLQKNKSFLGNIELLRSKNIIDESLKVKFKDIYNEYNKSQKSSKYKTSIPVAERCIANIYDIVKWYSNKYDKNSNQYDLSFLDQYLDIKEELMDIRTILFNDNINLQLGYNDAARKCRVVIESIVRQIQIKSNIQRQGDLYSDIKSIGSVMGSAAIPIIHNIRKNGNGAIHISDIGKVNRVKKDDALRIFNDTYNLARVFCIYMDMQKISGSSNKQKPKQHITNAKVESKPCKVELKPNKVESKKIINKKITNKEIPITKATSKKDKIDNKPKEKSNNNSWENEGYYEGNILNQKRHGHGKFTYKDGTVYTGNWKKDYFDGNGTMITPSNDAFTGKWYRKGDNMRWFEGTVKYSNGDIYIGECQYSTKTKSYWKYGRGKMIYKNGHSYEGYWQNDCKHGNFVVNEPEGLGEYKSKFDMDKRINHGGDISFYDSRDFKEIISKCEERIFANGNVYKGQIHRFLIITEKQGLGIMKYTNGDVYEGEWKNNSQTGHGRMKYANGDVYEGHWESNEKKGKGVMKYAKGQKKSGIW